MFKNPAAAAAAAAGPDSVRARRPRPTATKDAPEPDDDGKDRPLTRREQKMHSFLDRIDDFLNGFGKKSAAPKELPTKPVVIFDPVYMKYKTFMTNADVVLSLVGLVLTTLLLLFAPSDAKVFDLVRASQKSLRRSGPARERGVALPRVLSADLVLILLSGMAVNSFVLAIIRVVEREHKAEVEKKLFEEINEAYDIDPAKAAAYAEKAAAERADADKKRAALVEENEQRAKDGKRPKRHRVTVSGIVEADSVTDAIVPVVVFWPMVLGTIVVLQGANPVRGYGVIVMFTEMVLGASLAKLLNSTTAARHVFNVLQSLHQLTLLGMIGIQWWTE